MSSAPVAGSAGRLRQRHRLPEWERRQFIEARGFVCSYCGASGDRWGVNGGFWHLDHVVPISKGGALDRTNLALACDRCNSLKAESLPDDLAADLLALKAHVDKMLARAESWPGGAHAES